MQNYDDQWCSKDHNFRNRDLVKTLRPSLHKKSRDRDSGLEIWDRDSRLQNLCILPNFLSSLLSWIFSNFWHFPTCFGCFLPANNKKKILNYRKFTIPFLCNIQNLDTCSLWDRDETWNIRDRNLQKWVAESRDRNQVSRLHHWCMIIDICSLVLHQSYAVSNYSPMKNKNTFPIDRVKSWTKLIFETFLLLVYFNVFWLYFCFVFIFQSQNWQWRYLLDYYIINDTCLVCFKCILSFLSAFLPCCLFEVTKQS